MERPRTVRATIASLRLNLLFTPALCRTAPWRTLEAAIEGGVDLVQWRVKDGRDPEGARRALEICRRLHVPFLVNDDVELAVTIDADGAHVGQGDMPAARARERLGPDRLLGVSTHRKAEATQARDDGADYIGFGPMYPTQTKGYDHAQPPGSLRAQQQVVDPLPVFAIGGLTSERLATCVEREGLRRVAVSSAILGSDNAHEAAGAMRGILDRVWRVR